MKKPFKLNISLSIIVVIFTMMTTNLFSQTLGSGIFFQAVARDNSSNPAKDRKIYIQSSVIQATANGTAVLVEQHQSNTDVTGVFSISIGQGIKTGGTAASLTNIDWSKGPYYLNLKVSITPIAPITGWDYTKDWVDLGTTSFGAVPYALYAASAGGVDQKVSLSDTAKMLLPYAKNNIVTTLSTTLNNSLATKLTAVDTAAMLANYAKTSSLDILSTTNGTKLNAVDTASLSTRINLKANLTDVNSSLATKANTTDVTSSLALKADLTDVISSLATKANTADITTDLALKANLISPVFVTPSLGTPTFGVATNLTGLPLTTGVTGILPISNGGTGLSSVGTTGQVLSTNGSGALTWTTPTSSANASSITGVVAVANGGTGQTTVPGILSTLGFSSNNVAIGNLAGTPGIGVNANNVAIGGGAGKTAQGQSSISIGYVAGYANQGVNSLAIGGNAAQSSQGTQAVALGYAAGQNSQGANSVALGAFAGNSQVANSIAINATGSNLNPTTAGFYVNPVRATTATSSLLYYNTSTKEITSGASSFVDLTTSQTIEGDKTFLGNFQVNGRANVTSSMLIGSSSSDPSAILTANSTTQGFLPPRLTIQQRDAIVNPAQGLVLYCLNCGQYGELQVYNGSFWTNIVGGGASSIFQDKVYHYSRYSSVSGVYTFNGKTWSSVVTNGMPSNFYGDYYVGKIGNKSYYYVNSGGVYILYSFDGSDWVSLTIDKPSWFYGSSYLGVMGNKVYHQRNVWNNITSKNDGEIYSFDGISWTLVSTITDIRYFSSNSYVGVLNNKIYHFQNIGTTSDNFKLFEFNGTEWTMRSDAPPQYFNTSSYLGTINNKVYHFRNIGTTSDNFKVFEFDGSTWSMLSVAPPQYFDNSSYLGVIGNKAYFYKSIWNSVTGSENYIYQFDGLNWTIVSGTNYPAAASFGGWLGDRRMMMSSSSLIH